MRIVATLVATVCLLALSAAPAPAADAIAAGNDGALSLGSNWGPYETYHGASFRWVDNDAEIVLHGRGGEARVEIACEGGPSLGQRSFALRVLDNARRQVDHVVCDGAGRRTEMLLPAGGGEARFVLHADGGGKRVPGERRILNFRVFSIGAQRAGDSVADIVDPRKGVRLGEGWYPVERYKGQTFRWMQNDGKMFVSAGGAAHATLRMLLEVGPSVGSRQDAITVRDARGRTLLRTTLVGRGVVTVPLDQLGSGESEVVIAAAGANKRVPHDPRILNLRLFDASVVR
jgi:hypothetical protein